MPIPTPFHSRTSAVSPSQNGKDWAGYFAAWTYDTSQDSEYFALRHSAGLIDVSPLYKYEVKGPDAAAFLSRVTVKNVHKLKVGRVTYLCWCDDDGMVVDDGTVSRLDENRFRVTAADPALSGVDRLRRGYDVTIEDSSAKIATLSLQGPNSREILRQVAETDMDALKFFATTRCKLGGKTVWISRTGYTGDLGYEVWVANRDAENVWDSLVGAGQEYALLPAGLDAMDVTRIEAGFIMNGVDYYSANHCLTDERKNSPYEIGLGWTEQLDREPFIGQAALRREKDEGSRRTLVGLDVDWAEIEAVFDRYGLPPELPAHAWRDGRPIYDQNHDWIGQATSGVWSPTLKKNLALAQIDSDHADVGSKVQFEITAEYHRHTVTATVTQTPFFNPPRKRS